MVVTILQDRDGYEICFVEDVGFAELSRPTYEKIDWDGRSRRGGDGSALPVSVPVHSSSGHVMILENESDLSAILSSSSRDKLVVLDFGASWCRNCKRIGPLMENHVCCCLVCVTIFSPSSM